MPRTTRTYDLQDEADRLDDELDALAEEAADADPESAAREEAAAEAMLVEQQFVGVRWALDPPADETREPYEEVTLGALTTGEYARVTDRLDAARQERVGFGPDGGAMEGAGRVFFAAAGLVDAPFVDADADFEAKAQAVNDLPPQFTRWLEARVDDLTTPDVDVGNGFEARLAAKQSDQARNSP